MSKTQLQMDFCVSVFMFLTPESCLIVTVPVFVKIEQCIAFAAFDKTLKTSLSSCKGLHHTVAVGLGSIALQHLQLYVFGQLLTILQTSCPTKEFDYTCTNNSHKHILPAGRCASTDEDRG